MKKRILAILMAFSLCLIWLPLGPAGAIPASSKLSRDGLWYYDYYDSQILDYLGDEEHLVVPGTIDGHPMQTIYDGAFAGNTNLKTVELSGSITKIGGGAFSGCTNLVSIKSSANFVRVASSAFKNCTSLEILDLTFTGISQVNSYAVIGYSTFENCKSLKSFTIPDSVRGIEKDAFKGCASLETIYLHKNVRELGDGVFSGCTSLDGIWVAEDNNYFSNDEYGVLFNKDKTELLAAPGGLTGTYTVPDTVKTLANEAFSGCDKLETVIVPDTVTRMGSGSFKNCVSLKSFDIPTGVTIINEQTFTGCTSLDGIWAGEGNRWFSNDEYGVLFSRDRSKLIAAPGSITGTYTVPNTVKTISRYAFAGCGKLKTVLIPDGVTATGAGCFENCTSLKTVVLSGQATITEAQFRGCTALDVVVIKEIHSTYGKKAFENCTSLKSIYCISGRTDHAYAAFKNVTANMYYLKSNNQQSPEELKIHQYYGKITWTPLDSYCVAKGDGSKYAVGTDVGAIFLMMAEWNTLSGVSVDGQALTTDQYLSMTQGTSIILKDDYLKTLALGEHTLEVTYTDGTCSATFTLVEPCVHNTVKLPAVAPTCTKSGLTEGSSCSKCGEVFVKQKTIDTLGHDYSVTTVAPTCTEGGYDLHRCTNCGKTSQANKTAALGHIFGEWEIVTVPTVEEPGLQARQCQNCEKTEQQEIDALTPPSTDLPTEPNPTEPPVAPDPTGPTQPDNTAPVETEPQSTEPAAQEPAEQANLVPWIVAGAVLLVITAAAALYLLRKKS